MRSVVCSVFPNCTAKAKGERQVYVGQQLLEARELGGMVVRRPIDRVGGSTATTTHPLYGEYGCAVDSHSV